MGRVTMRLTTEDRARAEAVAAMLGTGWLNVVFLVLYGSLEEAEGKLSPRGVEMLRQLRDGITGGPPPRIDPRKRLEKKPNPPQ